MFLCESLDTRQKYIEVLLFLLEILYYTLITLGDASEINRPVIRVRVDAFVEVNLALEEQVVKFK